MSVWFITDHARASSVNELLLVAPGYAAARGDPVNRTEGSNQPPRLFLREHNMTEAI